MDIFAPSLAKDLQISEPIPPVTPVTKATYPVNGIVKTSNTYI